MNYACVNLAEGTHFMFLRQFHLRRGGFRLHPDGLADRITTPAGAGAALLLWMLIAGVLVGGAVGFFSFESAPAGGLEDYIASRFLYESFPAALAGAAGGFLLLLAAATSYLGVVLVPALLFLRAYLFSCSVSGLYALFSLRGLGCALLISGIPALLIIPCFYCISCDAMDASRRLFSLRFHISGTAGRSCLALRLPVAAAVVLFDAIYGYYILPRILDSVSR